MSDDTKGDKRAGRKPTEADERELRSLLQGLAEGRGNQARAGSDTRQEVLPPDDDRRARLRELLRNRQGGGEAGGRGLLRRGGEGEGEDALRNQLLRRALRNRRNDQGGANQTEGGDGRQLRERGGGGGGGRQGGRGGGAGRLLDRLGARSEESEAVSGGPVAAAESKPPPVGFDSTADRPLGVADIPGAIPPAAARRTDENTVGAGQDRGKMAEAEPQRGRLGGGERSGRPQGLPGERIRELQGRGGGDASADPVARGRELLDRLRSRLNESGNREGGQSQRLAAGLGLIDQGYTKLEQEVERQKKELADMEEMLRTLLGDD